MPSLKTYARSNPPLIRILAVALIGCAIGFIYNQYSTLASNRLIKGRICLVIDDFGFAFNETVKGFFKLDKNIIPSNFWNIDVMYQDKIFDTQKGIVRKLSVKESGKEIIIINNTKIDCTKFILNATRHSKDKDLFPEYTLWYSEDKELMKFKFRSTKNNKIIEIIRK